MKNFLTQYIITLLVFGFVLAQPSYAQSVDIEDFVTQTGIVSRIGSLFISDNTNETLDANSAFGKNSGGGKNADCTATKGTARKETCLEVNGLGYLYSLFAEVPVSVINRIGVGITNVGSFIGNSKLTVGGNILDWDLALRDITGAQAPLNLTNLRAVCADSNGRLMICGDVTGAEPVDWNFDFFVHFDNKISSNTSEILNLKTYNGKNYLLSYPTGETGPHQGYSAFPATSSYVTMFRIAGDGDFGDIECQVSMSPIGYPITGFSKTVAYGPRTLSSMRWDDVTMTNAVQSYLDASSGSTIPTVTILGKTYNLKSDPNNTSTPFYAFPAFTFPRLDEKSVLGDGSAKGYTQGVVRCRTKTAPGYGSGDWKYQATSVIKQEGNVSSFGLKSGSSNTLVWTSAVNDTNPVTFWYSLYKQKCTTSQTGGFNGSSLTTCEWEPEGNAVQANSYTFQNSFKTGCSDPRFTYALGVSACNPNMLGRVSGTCGAPVAQNGSVTSFESIRFIGNVTVGGQVCAVETISDGNEGGNGST